ncbi:MAG: hypothetical protein HRU19_27490 [Pseudobacteriovorax sp.]|nr:hypothetical protein [Pseudobacteriovorax sp.]
MNQAWIDGEAVNHALAIRHLLTPVGELIPRPIPQELSQILSWATLILEGLLVPAVLFVNRTWRNFIAAFMIIFHASIATVLAVSWFSPLMMMLWFSLIQWNTNEPSVPLVRLRPLISAAVVAYLCVVNVVFLLSPWHGAMWNPVTQIFRLDQSWLMFDNPQDQPDGWMVVKMFGHDDNLLSGQDPYYKTPSSIAQTYPSHRWLKWHMSLIKGNGATFEGSRRYACSQMDRREAELEVLFMRFVEDQMIEEQFLLEADCVDELSEIHSH